MKTRPTSWWFTALLLLGLSVLMALLSGWPTIWLMETRLVLASLFFSLGWPWFFMKLRQLRQAALTAETSVPASSLWNWPAWLVLALMSITMLLGFSWFVIAPPALESLALRLEAHFAPARAAERALAATSMPPAKSGHWLWQDGSERQLPSRTNLKPGTKPEVFLKFSDSDDAVDLVKSKAYVRAFAFENYAEGAWSARGGRELRLEVDPTGWATVSVLRSRKVIHHEVFHAADPSGNTPLLALQGVVAAGIGPLKLSDEGVQLLPPPSQAGGYHYRVASQPLLLDDLPDGQWLRAQVDPQGKLLQLPTNPELRRWIHEFAQADGIKTDLKSQLIQIRKSLQTQFTYSLQTTNSEQLDPLENFLLHERRGHCEHFATAAALMARSLGVPARVAYGWSGGTWFESAGLLMFRASEAHAWAEVFLDSFGWVILDATPPNGISPSRVALPDEALAKALDETKGQSKPGLDSAEGLLSPNPWPTWPALCVAGLVGLFVWWRLGCRSRHNMNLLNTIGGGHQQRISPPPGYLQAWQQVLQESGNLGHFAMPLRQQVRDLECPPPFADALWQYHYATTYENHPRNLGVEQELLEKIRSSSWRSSALKN